MIVQHILKLKGSAAVETIAPSAPVADAAATLATKRFGALVVSADGETIAGILSERDIVRALARELDLDHRQVARALPLAFLAPDIVAAIVEGRQPVDLTARKLERLGDLPIGWSDQRIALGIAAGT